MRTGICSGIGFTSFSPFFGARFGLRNVARNIQLLEGYLRGREGKRMSV